MKVLLLLGVALSGLAIAASVPGKFFLKNLYTKNLLIMIYLISILQILDFQTRSCAIMEDGLFTDQEMENSTWRTLIPSFAPI